MEILQGGIYSLFNAIATAMVFGVLINEWKKDDIIKLSSFILVNFVMFFFLDMTKLLDVCIVITAQIVYVKVLFKKSTFNSSILAIKYYLIMIGAGLMVTNLFIIIMGKYIDFRSVYSSREVLVIALYLPLVVAGALFVRKISSIRQGIQSPSLRVQKQLLIANVIFAAMFGLHQRLVADYSFIQVKELLFDVEKLQVQWFMLFNYLGVTALILIIGVLTNRGIVSQKNFEKFKFKAEIDRMSGAFTRDAGLSHLNRAMMDARSKNQPLTICYLDVNDLKVVNDKYGHQTGDLYIRTIAMEVKECLRDFDCLARLGGDEFLVVFSKCTLAQGKKAWERINQRFEEVNENGEYIFRLSASAGLCQYNESRHKNVKVFIHEADERMYREKRILKSKRGKNNVVR